VGLAVADMEMAPRDIQGIVPTFRVQMDSEHVDASIRKVQVVLEPPNQPAATRLFHFDIETEPGIGPKLDFFAHQFLKSSFEGVEPGDVVCLFQSGTVCLLCQIMTELTTKNARMIDYHLRETRLVMSILSVSR
jgi:hypothetical protein